MEVSRTVPVKLEVPEKRRDDLHQTIQQFNAAANYTVDHGSDDDGDLILSKSAIHDEVYHDLRDETDLPANLVVRAYSKAVEGMKATVADWTQGNSRPLPSFDEPSAVYDKRTLTIKDEYATLSTVDGRVEADFVLGAYQRSYLEDDDYEKRMGDAPLQSRGGRVLPPRRRSEGGRPARRRPRAGRGPEPEERRRDQHGTVLRRR